MASTAPPILPVSTPSTTTTNTNTAASTSSSQPPIATPAIGSIFRQIRSGLSRSRPWSELADRTAFAHPNSISDATFRLRRNYSYFRLNYLLLVSIFIAFSLFSHPASLLLLLALISAWTFLYLLRPSDQPIYFGRSFSDREMLGILVIVTVFVVFLTSVGSVLISAILVGIAVVCAHGSYRVPDDLFLEEQEQSSSSFLSFIGGAAKNVASAAPAVVAAARV